MSDCGILVPFCFQDLLRLTFEGDRFFGTLLGKWIFVSAHLIWAEHVAESTLSDISWEISKIRSKYVNEEFAVVIGIDANVSMFPNMSSFNESSGNQVEHTGSFVLTTKHNEADRLVFRSFLESEE